MSSHLCSHILFFPAIMPLFCSPLFCFLLYSSCLTSLIFPSKIWVAYWWYYMLSWPFKYTGISSVLLLQSLSPAFPHHLATLSGPQRGLCPVSWPSAPLQCCLSMSSLWGGIMDGAGTHTNRQRYDNLHSSLYLNLLNLSWLPILRIHEFKELNKTIRCEHFLALLWAALKYTWGIRSIKNRIKFPLFLNYRAILIM